MPAVFRCRATHFGAVALVLALSWLASASAFAQDSTAPAAPAASVPAAAAPMPADRPLYEGTRLGIASSFGADSPQVFLAGSTGSVLWGIGVANFKYDGNAVASPTNPGGDKTTADLVVSLAYMVHNQYPFAMGPEVDYIPTLAPKSFDTNVIQAGWALWYAPFHIPAVIGTAALVTIVMPPSPGKAVVTAVTPAVRIVFGFH
jgi:hypothetical protein